MAAKKKTAGKKAWPRKALDLAAEGETIAAIARKLDKPPTTVRDRVRSETADPADLIKKRRDEKNDQLEAIIDGLYDEATAGGTQAAAIMIAAIKEQIRLHGLDAPVKLDVNAKLSMAQDSTTTILNMLTKFKATDGPSSEATRGEDAPIGPGRDDAGGPGAVPGEPQS